MFILSITGPNGLCIDIFGPKTGRNNDLAVLSRSGIVSRLERMFGHASPFRVFGDSAYRTDGHVISHRHSGVLVGEQEEAESTCMSAQRTSVEHFFGITVNLWRHVDFRGNIRILTGGDSGRTYRLAVLLTNMHTCANGGNQISLKFGISPPSLHTYMRGGIVPQI